MNRQKDPQSALGGRSRPGGSVQRNAVPRTDRQGPSCLLLGRASGLELDYPIRTVPYTAWLGHVPFAFWLVEVSRPSVIVELGVHTGNSYCAFLQAVQKLNLETRCFGIDHWRGDEHAGFYGDEVYQELRTYQDPLYGSFSTLICARFDDALKKFSEGNIDLLHIDGFHTYEAVSADFANWLPKMSGRGIVMFHDTQERERDFGIWRVWEDVAATYPSFEFVHSHGLGVAYVGGESLPPPLSSLFETKSKADIERVRGYFTRLGASVQDRFVLGEIQARVKVQTKQADAADGELRRLLAEVEQRDQQLVGADQELRRLAHDGQEREQRLAIADADLRRLLAEVEQRDQQLVKADQELRRLAHDGQEREQRLRETVETLQSKLSDTVETLESKLSETVLDRDTKARLLRQQMARGLRLRLDLSALRNQEAETEHNLCRARKCIADLEQDKGLASRRIDELTQELERARQQQLESQEHIDELTQDAARARRQQHESQERIDELTQEAARARQQQRESEEQRMLIEQQLQLLVHSRSWRVTAPLRSATRRWANLKASASHSNRVR